MNRNTLRLRRKPFVRIVLGITGLLLLSVVGASALSDDGKRDLDAKASAILAAPADKQITDALARISAPEVEHTIATLVTFHNRSTISSMDTDLPKGQGVSAAADWIESELKRYSEECGGCLEVKRDTFTEPPQSGPHPRIAQSTTISNVYAILRGSD